MYLAPKAPNRAVSMKKIVHDMSIHFYIDMLYCLWLGFSLLPECYCTLFTVNCSCSPKGALTAIKDPGSLEEAITRGDLSTAKKLLGITESGKLRMMANHKSFPIHSQRMYEFDMCIIDHGPASALFTRNSNYCKFLSAILSIHW